MWIAIVAAVLWIASGTAVPLYMLYPRWDRGEDITDDDLGFAAIFMVFGPIGLLSGLAILAAKAFCDAMEESYKNRKPVIRGRTRARPTAPPADSTA